jgi:hypothetical protein
MPCLLPRWQRHRDSRPHGLAPIGRAMALTLAVVVIAAAGLFALSLLWLGPPKPTAAGLYTSQLLDVIKLTLAASCGGRRRAGACARRSTATGWASATARRSAPVGDT